MRKNTRVGGHELRDEGAAFTALGPRLARVKSRGTGGVGVGMCWCGAISAVLTSGNLRKAWHRNHKAEVLAERSAP